MPCIGGGRRAAGGGRRLTTLCVDKVRDSEAQPQCHRAPWSVERGTFDATRVTGGVQAGGYPMPASVERSASGLVSAAS